MTNNKKICFIICVNNDQYEQECINYISRLNIPDGYEIEQLSVREASSMAAGYNEAMGSTDAKYKFYLHQDTFIVNNDILYDILKTFEDESIGMIGMVGTKAMPQSGIMWDGKRIGHIYSNHVLNTTEFFEYDSKSLTDVDAIDGLLMITQYDIKWRDDIFTGWDFYDASQSFEFRQHGYRVVVPYMDKAWCIHDDGILNLEKYFEWRDIFSQEYMGNSVGNTIGDFIELIDREDAVIHLGYGVSVSRKMESPIILVSHALSRTGAPNVLLDAAKECIELNHTVFLLCHMEGAMLEDFIQAGVNVIIYPNYMQDAEWFKLFRHRFSCWIINTLIMYPVCLMLNHTEEKAVWWIHENEYYFDRFKDSFKDFDLSSNIRIMAAGPYIQKVIEVYFKRKCEILNFEVADCAELNKNVSNTKIKFLQAASAEGIKGQEIFAQAIDMLDKEVLDKSEFIFCCNMEVGDSNIIKAVRECAKNHSNVTIIPPLPKRELNDLYEQIDVVVVPSYLETTSAVMVEAMMHRKIGICSDMCGISYYMRNRIDGFIFPNQNSEELSAIISYIVLNFDSCKRIGINGRHIYEDYFSHEIFAREMKNIVE